ncbi:MAG: hypothetical protein AAB442_03005 [Patescibacteria group bacterium]
MAQKTVLAVSNSDDAHVRVVAQRLNERSIDVHRLDSDTFASDHHWCIPSDNKDSSLTGFIPNVDVVWYRKVVFPEARTIVQSFVRQEIEGLFDSLLAEYDNCRWVNPRNCLSAARPKISQLKRAKQLGFRVPDTLITSSLEELKVFAASHDGRIVAKPIQVQVVGSGNDSLVVGTRNLSPEHYESAISCCPGYFQEKLPFTSEIRVIVFGKQQYPFRLTARKDAADIKQLKLKDIKHEQCRLDGSTSKKIDALMASYGLEFGAVDLADIGDEEPVFFELNPNGQWLWLQYMTGENLLDPFIDLLCC